MPAENPCLEAVRILESWDFSYKLYQLERLVYRMNKEKGFWEDFPDTHSVAQKRYLAVKVALIHTEVSELLEALRKDDEENLCEEVADIFIRLLDFAGRLGIDLARETEKKLRRNWERPRKHGKVF